jgi:hypothetical protein
MNSFEHKTKSDREIKEEIKENLFEKEASVVKQDISSDYSSEGNLSIVSEKGEDR